MTSFNSVLISHVSKFDSSNVFILFASRRSPGIYIACGEAAFILNLEATLNDTEIYLARQMFLYNVRSIADTLFLPQSMSDLEAPKTAQATGIALTFAPTRHSGKNVLTRTNTETPQDMLRARTIEITAASTFNYLATLYLSRSRDIFGAGSYIDTTNFETEVWISIITIYISTCPRKED